MRNTPAELGRFSCWGLLLSETLELLPSVFLELFATCFALTAIGCHFTKEPGAQEEIPCLPGSHLRSNGGQIPEAHTPSMV